MTVIRPATGAPEDSAGGGRELGSHRSLSSGDALEWIGDRRREVDRRLADIQRRLATVRAARGGWTDEEHDPEGFALVHEWAQAEGRRSEHLNELRELDDAEARAGAGTFGICVVCGDPISTEQLRLRPGRVSCVACSVR